MDIFSRRLSALCLLLATALASAQAPDIPSAGLPGSRVDELLVLARRQNTDLAASGFELEAAQARVHSAAALPDPIGRLELRDVTNRADNGSFNLLPGRVGSTRYTLAQTFPWWGKRDLKRQVAEADAAQAEARRASAWSELAAKVKTGFAQYYLAGHSLQLNGELLRLAETLEQLAQARYAGGLAAQQDVLRAQVEKSNLRGERLRLESESRQTAARLNGLLRRPPTAPLAEARVLRPLPSTEQLADGALSARLLAANPQLAAQEAQLVRPRQPLDREALQQAERLGAAAEPQQGLAALHGDHLEPFQVQGKLQRHAQRRIVVHEQDARAHPEVQVEETVAPLEERRHHLTTR